MAFAGAVMLATISAASYRLRGRGIDSLPSIRTTTDQGRLDSPQPLTFQAPEAPRFGASSPHLNHSFMNHSFVSPPPGHENELVDSMHRIPEL